MATALTAAWSDDEAVEQVQPAPPRMQFFHGIWYAPFNNGRVPIRFVDGRMFLDEPYLSMAVAHHAKEFRRKTIAALVKPRPRPRRSRR